jgi:PAS domain S-box-containing protein
MKTTIQLPGGVQAYFPNPIILFALILFAVLVLLYLLRIFLRGKSEEKEDVARPAEAGETAFAAASVQAVIQKLREKERELARLHQFERERAQRTERLSEAVTRNMPTGMLVVGANSLVNLSNPAAEQTLGVGALQYRRYSDVLGPRSRLTALLDACLREGRTFQREEIDHSTAGGETRHLGVTISPIGKEQGKVTGALCLMSDLTELTVLQRQMRLRESLAALGEMSAGIAHEFKNSLATLCAYAQLIQQEAGGGELAENAGKILSEARSLTHVVTEFLRFARPMEVEGESVAMGALVARALAEVREAFPGVTLSCSGEFAEVAGDEGLLRQALLNLVRNAAEAASDSSSLAAGREGGLSSKRGRVEIIGAVEDLAGRRMQRLAVCDNGPGIRAEDLPKIFLPFFTTKSSGTGLGLAVVQKIAVQHGGSAEAKNRPGGGAEFIVWLPTSAPRVDAVDSVRGGI